MKVFQSLFALCSADGAKLPPFLLAGARIFLPLEFRVSEFQQAIDSPKMKQLRQLLVDTIDLQAQFLIARLQDALPKMHGPGRLIAKMCSDNSIASPLPHRAVTHWLTT